MIDSQWLQKNSPAFRLMIATSWLAPDSWQRNQEAAIREAVAAKPDWTEFLHLVDRHRTPALSWAALKRVPGLEIPKSAEAELRRRSDACRMQAMRHCLHLASVLKAFSRAGISIMPLKGPLLSEEIYGDIGLRQSQDLDMVVLPSDLTRAQSCLNDLGWRLDATYDSMSPRQWEKFLRMEQHLGFVEPRGECLLELHWRILWDTPGLNSARWARGVSSVWQGCSHQSMNSVDQVLYLCCHGAEHAWCRAKWLGDLARFHAAGLIDWQVAFEQACSTRQEKPLLLCLRLLEIVHCLPMPRLECTPWEPLLPSLIDNCLYALQINRESTTEGALELLPYRLSFFRYRRLILPRNHWRASLSELAYCREDFRVLRLPDSLFWAYVPLRPFLWIWRRLKLFLRRIARPQVVNN